MRGIGQLWAKQDNGREEESVGNRVEESSIPVQDSLLVSIHLN